VPGRRERHSRRRSGSRGRDSQKFCPLPKDLCAFLPRLEGNFNFGLYFNKWLQVEEKSGVLSYEFQSKGQAQTVLERYEAVRSRMSEHLRQKQQEIDVLVKAFEKLGFASLMDETYKLRTPLILGLGNAHPTERGFTFHWTLGIPYIPAESIASRAWSVWPI